MGLRLVLYLSLLLIGAIIGNRGKISKTIDENLGKIQNICLLFLLFVMGITIGVNDEIVSNLVSIGFRAGVIAIFTIIFSIVSVHIIKTIFKLEVDEIES